MRTPGSDEKTATAPLETVALSSRSPQRTVDFKLAIAGRTRARPAVDTCIPPAAAQRESCRDLGEPVWPHDRIESVSRGGESWGVTDQEDRHVLVQVGVAA